MGSFCWLMPDRYNSGNPSGSRRATWTAISVRETRGPDHTTPIQKPNLNAPTSNESRAWPGYLHPWTGVGRTVRVDVSKLSRGVFSAREPSWLSESGGWGDGGAGKGEGVHACEHVGVRRSALTPAGTKYFVHTYRLLLATFMI